MSELDDLLTTAEAAALLRCSDRHVRRLIDAEVLAASDISVPGSPRPVWRIRSEAVSDLLTFREAARGLDGHDREGGRVNWTLAVEEHHE